MKIITFISTVHIEQGKCNADELCAILERLRPEVVFLEALASTYSDYQKLLFSSFRVYHQKLELSAIQKYTHTSPIKYVPVLDQGLSELFEKKYNMISKSVQHQSTFFEYNLQVQLQGFEFLNSKESTELQGQLRAFEEFFLNDDELINAVNEDLNNYENSMMQNIYSWCENNQFDRAIFMCGVAHRQSIINKIESYSSNKELNINWEIYGD